MNSTRTGAGCIWKSGCKALIDRGRLLLMGCLLLPLSMWGQANLLEGKRIGLYVSSSQFSLPGDYYMATAQFLKIGEDRSGVGDLKAELMIRLGNMLADQLKEVALCDSVSFLNADMYKGRLLQQMYDRETNQLKDTLSQLEGIDLILVLNELDLQIRNHRSVFFQSNNMITKKVKVKHAEMSATLLDPLAPELTLQFRSCFDEQQSPKTNYFFDFYQKESPLGDFFSQLFSRWWYQMQEGTADSCPED